MTDTERTDGAQRVHDLLSDSSLCMFTTRTDDGRLLSRPMALQEQEFDGDLWFFAAADSRKAVDIARDPAVNVSFQSGTSWVSVSGTAGIVRDDAKKKDLWSAAVSAWFPGGVDDDNVVLVKVTAEGAEYWAAPGSKVTTLIAYAKSRITGKRPDDIGDNETVDLS